MRIRVVVADQAEARFYDLEHKEDVPRLAGQLSDPVAHLHDRDLKSDRPGRAFDHAPVSGHRRGSTPHHGIGVEHRPRRHEAEVFAHKIAEQLEHARRSGEFDRLVIMAPPAFLGLLRKALPQSLQACVAAEMHKSLVHEPLTVLRAHLPDEAFGNTLPSGH